MGDLTLHFSRSEFACKCGCGFNGVSMRLVEALEKFRAIVGRPIKILSGCRCPEHNRDVGGEANSYHKIGRAADIVVAGFTTAELYSLARRSGLFNGLGYYPSKHFIHVDNRMRLTEWSR